MKITVGQIYIQPGIAFPFSHLFQRWMSKELSDLIRPSANFIRRYGDDFTLVLNVSAKPEVRQPEIKGPTVFERTKDVEYTIFLPYDKINESSDVIASAVRSFLDSVVSVFDSLEFDSSEVVKRAESIIERVCSDTSMIKKPR